MLNNSKGALVLPTGSAFFYGQGLCLAVRAWDTQSLGGKVDGKITGRLWLAGF